MLESGIKWTLVKTLSGRNWSLVKIIIGESRLFGTEGNAVGMS